MPQEITATNPTTGETIPSDGDHSREEDDSGEADGTKTSNETAVPQKSTPIIEDAQPVKSFKRFSRPSSPPPFSQYARPNVETKPTELEQLQMDEDDRGGCCRCIIM